MRYDLLVMVGFLSLACAGRSALPPAPLIPESTDSLAACAPANGSPASSVIPVAELQRTRASSLLREALMQRCWLGLVATAVPALLAAQTGRGPYARIAVLRPHDGQTVEFEAGYLRHLAWHQGAKDPWTWYGWSIWAGDRYRWFVYATFGHSAGSLDSAVTPAEDERDNLMNVSPHVEWVTNGLYEFLPALSHGTGEPPPTPRLEVTTVDLLSGTAQEFEAALQAAQSRLAGETLWYRMVAGGPSPRYVRLRPQPGLSAILRERNQQELPEAASRVIAKMTVEIWTLRPTLSLGLGAK